MTLDVRIGKLTTHTDEDLQDEPWVDVCPEIDFDVCSLDYTISPRAAYRSGSRSFWNFFQKKSQFLAEIYYEMREYPNTNDRDVVNLKPYLDRILNIPEDDFLDEDDIEMQNCDLDRLKWLKFWSKRAVELYDDKAGITFS